MSEQFVGPTSAAINKLAEDLAKEVGKLRGLPGAPTNQQLADLQQTTMAGTWVMIETLAAHIDQLRLLIGALNEPR